MSIASVKEKQPWATCLFTDILLSHLEETAGGENKIDYRALFAGAGSPFPPDPPSFLRDATNWVPLKVLRELLSQCEEISGEKDFGYHAAKAYFHPGRKQPSLFEIIARALNDVRSVLVCSNLWASVQTNYLNLQSFERKDAEAGLYILARFDESAKPGPGTMSLVRGICEGFPRLYSFIEEARCVEEISQVKIEDIVREFPDFTLSGEGDCRTIRRQGSDLTVVEAVKLPLRSDSVPVSEEFRVKMSREAVVPIEDGRVRVLTNLEETDRKGKAGVEAYRIVKSGTISSGALSYTFENDRIYDAPYSRFRFIWKEGRRETPELNVGDVRGQISELLFEHLSQMRQLHTQMIEDRIEQGRLARENTFLREEALRQYSFEGMISQTDTMRNLFALVRSIAGTDVTVLVQGETGTGKELIAQAIHYNSSRKEKRFVAINCGSFSETLLESELFGHEKGAFTGAIAQRKGIFEVAHGGTLFLDEIGEITPGTQVRLLRVLQEGELLRVGGADPIRVDVRIIAATNKKLEDLVKAGRFREDLYYRLNVFPLLVPPLRERVEDIPLLVSHFIEKWRERLRKSVTGISPQALALLTAHSWPGNVRELENAIQRAMVIATGETLQVEEFPAELGAKASGFAIDRTDLKGIARGSAGVVEKSVIVEALSKNGGNITRAAKYLGISRVTLQKKMKIYGLRKSGN